MGRARRRRIRSRSANSLSLRSASRRLWRVERGFFKGLLQDRQYGAIARAICRLLALNDISQCCHDEFLLANADSDGAFSQAFEGTNAVDLTHEVQLQAILIPGDSQQSA